MHTHRSQRWVSGVSGALVADQRTIGGESLLLKTALSVHLPTQAELSITTPERGGSPQAGFGLGCSCWWWLWLTQAEGQRKNTIELCRLAGWASLLSACASLMPCVVSLSHRSRLHHSAGGARVDLLAATLSHVGLAVLQKVLTASCEDAGVLLYLV